MWSATEPVYLPLRLGYAEFQFAGAKSIDVADGPVGGIRRTTDTVLLMTLVDQTANCAASKIISAGHAAGSNEYKSLRLLCAGKSAGHQASGRKD